MERIGVRELRQHASRWLRRVAEGETYEITMRGVPVARLSPVERQEDALERLAREGIITLATEDIDEVMDRLGLPLEIPPGVQPPSERLAELRRHER